MRIDWNKNPIRTTVHLTDAEKEVFRLKVRLNTFESSVRMAVFYLDEKNREKGRHDPVRALQYLRHAQREEKPEDDLGEDLISQLETGCHCGDCTCFAMSCDRCFAEELLGIDTIKGLRKHSAAKIDGAFGKDSERTMDEALAALADYRPERSGGWLNLPAEDFEKHVPKWREDARQAHDWLVAYRAEKSL